MEKYKLPRRGEDYSNRANIADKAVGGAYNAVMRRKTYSYSIYDNHPSGAVRSVSIVSVRHYYPGIKNASSKALPFTLQKKP